MKAIVLSGTLLLTGLCNAASPINGWYAGAFGGYSYLPDNISSTSNGFIRSNALYQSGYNAGGRLGYKGNPLRYELETTYINANLKSFETNYLPQTNVNGYSNATVTLANLYYDFADLSPVLEPFVGVGLGYGWVENKFISFQSPLTSRFKAGNGVFAYQVTAGVNYDFSENYGANLAYHYVSTERVEVLNKFFQAHLINLGLVYRFDMNHYK